MRIPVRSDGNGHLKAGPCPSASGCLDFDFGLHALEDAPGDELSYDLASLVPDKAGNMVLVYGRVPVKMATPIGQEARYSVFYDDARGLARSRLIQPGGAVLKGNFCANGKTDKTATAENYFHIWYGSDTCTTQPDFQDYGTAAIDPDGKSVWIAHAYADGTTKRFKMVAAKLTP